jgi:tRNA-(ms[2]io[6]A)-hydroxylase
MFPFLFLSNTSIKISSTLPPLMTAQHQKVMLGLKLPTDPRWIELVEKDLQEILTDHAYCEQKAASNAISVIVKFPEYTEVVTEMIRICNEEMTHFGMVHNQLIQRGLTLGRERKDPYVHDLLDFIRKGGSREEQFVDRMLFAAMIEARSCERFRLLSEKMHDPELRTFYRDLMESEAEHYTTFIGFARKFSNGIDVDKRWADFLLYESQLMSRYGKAATMHG